LNVIRGTPSPLAPHARELLETAAGRGIRPANELSVEQARAQVTSLFGPLADSIELHAVSEVDITAQGRQMPGRRYTPTPAPAATALFLHGGGWVVGNLDMVDRLCRGLAEATRCEVVSIAYALAPERPYPEALLDTMAALDWIVRERGDQPLVVIGESAGGNLAAVACQRARDSGPRIDLQVLIYPITDAELSGRSYVDHGDGPGTLTKDAMEWYCRHYVPRRADRADPDVSPLRADDFAGLPPSLVVVAEHDPLRDDGLNYAEALASAGVPVEVDYHPDMTHGFLGYWGTLSAAQRAFDRVVDAVQRAVDAAR
jgi:acetyl esterase